MERSAWVQKFDQMGPGRIVRLHLRLQGPVSGLDWVFNWVGICSRYLGEPSGVRRFAGDTEYTIRIDTVEGVRSTP
jgi:hypothetical protein